MAVKKGWQKEKRKSTEITEIDSSFDNVRWVFLFCLWGGFLSAILLHLNVMLVEERK
jgi:hypothetical protein